MITPPKKGMKSITSRPLCSLWLFVLLCLPSVAREVLPGTRDPWRWPFDSTSIWNMPIGSDAEYTDIDMVPTRGVGMDARHFLELDLSHPEREVIGFDVFAPEAGRCSGTTDMNGLTVHIPDTFIVADVFSGSQYGVTPNAAFVFLMPDRQNVWNGPSIARCQNGGPLYMRSFQKWPNNRIHEDIFGDGVTNSGGHGASSMSGLGGTIRKGDFSDSEPIRHAIKINPSSMHLFYSASIPGYRWPAIRADNYAAGSYTGENPALVMGSLLAVPPGVTAQQLGIRTEPARKILFTLQNYGAYICEDAGPRWDVFDFVCEAGVEAEFENAFGFSMDSQLWEDDILKIAAELKVIGNNGPNSIGGGGTPLQPLAPLFGEATPVVMPDRRCATGRIRDQHGYQFYTLTGRLISMPRPRPAGSPGLVVKVRNKTARLMLRAKQAQ